MWRAGWVWSVLLLSGCGTPGVVGRPHGAMWGYSHGSPGASLDSATAGCRHSPSACVAAIGKEVASVVAVGKVVLDANLREAIDAALARCADSARSEVLQRHEKDFGRPFPSVEDCNRLVEGAARKDLTWALLLGQEMHEEARACARLALNLLVPDRFRLEQRYLYDRRTGRKRPISPEEELLLEQTGNLGELRGSLVPDVVIHSGDPLEVQEVYDFKFRCANTDVIPSWRRYPNGHPYENETQGSMYQEAFGVDRPALVAPRLGITR